MYKTCICFASLCICELFHSLNVRAQPIWPEFIWSLLQPKDKTGSLYFSTNFMLTELSLNQMQEHRYYDSVTNSFVFESSDPSYGRSYLAGFYTNMGITIGKRYSAGIGTGFEKLLDPTTIAFPIFVTVRVHLLKEYPANCLYADIGKIIPINANANLSNNSFLRYGLGVQLYRMSKVHFVGLMNVDYRTFFVPDKDRVNYGKEILLNGTNLGLGIHF